MDTMTRKAIRSAMSEQTDHTPRCIKCQKYHRRMAEGQVLNKGGYGFKNGPLCLTCLEHWYNEIEREFTWLLGSEEAQ